MPYVSLHNHTSFSIMDALSKPSELFAKAKELGQPAIAVTDHGSCAGLWDSLKASRETGVKLIAGCEFYFVDDVNDQEARMRHVILLAKNAVGYKNLLMISKFGYENIHEGFKKVHPRIDWKVLEEHSEGLICTTACANGIIAQLIGDKKTEEAKECLSKLKNIFGNNLAIEVQPNALKRTENSYSSAIDQVFINRKLIAMAQENGVKMIAATNSHYINKEQHEDHDVILAVGAGQPIYSNARLKYSVPDFYVKSEDEVRAFFSRNYSEDIVNQLIDNTIYFSDMCEQAEWIDPKYSNPSGKELPEFPVKDQEDYQDFLKWKENCKEDLAEDKLYLRYLCDKNFDRLVTNVVEPEKIQLYKDRIVEELDVLESKDFCSYMLIVADFLEYARKNNVRLGYGRGSVGGSLVAYLLGIHLSDPIKYNMIFARFLNKFKMSFPDIDSDLSSSGRDLVQEYIRNKYGHDNVAHVSNISVMTAKVYARDIARAFEFGDDRKKAVFIGTAIADSIPAEIKKPRQALEDAPLFAEFAKKYTPLEKYIDTVGGKARQWATHAAGIVIGRRNLNGLVPLRCDKPKPGKKSNFAVEADKERAEELGLIKIDTLGLETLDIITQTYELIKERGKVVPPDYFNFDGNEDKATYDLISAGDTLCVFQFGTSGGTIELCKAVKPKNVQDLAIITALARPSAADIRSDFIKVRFGEKPFELMHPSLERAFKDTLGFGLYEECLMYLAQDVAGWDLHEADNLRKLTKEKGKDPAKAKKLRKKFIEDAQKNKDIDSEISSKIWDDIVDKFQGYGFNIPHATLYSMLSYHTAYLKCHYRLEFLVANLMSQVESNSQKAEDNIVKIKEEIRQMGVKILPPNINTSSMTYRIIDDNTVMTGLDALKFMGKNAIPEIVAKRPFTSFEDFLSKVDGRKVTSKAIQALVASGCLDFCGIDRKTMYLYAGDYKKRYAAWAKRKSENKEPFEYPWPVGEEEWSIPEKWALEKHYLGEGITGNVKDLFPDFFNKKTLCFNDLPQLYPEPTTDEEKAEQRKDKPKIQEIRGVVRNIFTFLVKKENSKIFGQTMARLSLLDSSGNEISIVIFPGELKTISTRMLKISGNKAELIPGMAISMSGYVSWHEGQLSLIFENLYDYRDPPSLPVDLKAKKVVIPRKKKQIKNKSSKESLLKELEDEADENGITDNDDDDELNSSVIDNVDGEIVEEDEKFDPFA